MKSTRSKKRGSVTKRVVRTSAGGTSTKRRSVSRSTQTPVARVKRVTREVVQQASVAVTAGMETLKGLGENLVDRVRS